MFDITVPVVVIWQALLSDREKLCQLLEQHPKLMQMLQVNLPPEQVSLMIAEFSNHMMYSNCLRD